jgi:hypothetical protein
VGEPRALPSGADELDELEAGADGLGAGCSAVTAGLPLCFGLAFRSGRTTVRGSSVVFCSAPGAVWLVAGGAILQQSKASVATKVAGLLHAAGFDPRERTRAKSHATWPTIPMNIFRSTANMLNRHRGCRCSAFAQRTDANRPIQRTGAPRPTRSRVTHDRQQVSWLAGRCLEPPSQGHSSPVAFMVLGSPLTVAGAAAELPANASSPHSLD